VSTASGQTACERPGSTGGRGLRCSVTRLCSASRMPCRTPSPAGRSSMT
jgi:hypothetical protein